MKVGFIGLGSQGLPIAQRILQAGYSLHLWARRDATLEPFAGTSAVRLDSPADLGRMCEFVGVCVVNDADVRDVVIEQGLLAAMAPGSLLAIHATVAPDTVQAIAKVGAERGVDVLDAPVSGGSAAAEAATLAVMVGGEVAAFERARPVLETFGNPVQLLGGVGTGQLCKLINNGLFTANVKLAADALQIGVSLGLDPAALTTMLAAGSAASFALGSLGRLTTPAGAPHAVGLLSKDVGLLAEVTREHGLEPTTLQHVATETVDMLRTIAATADG